VNGAIAEFAGDACVEVFPGGANFFLAVGAISIEGDRRRTVGSRSELERFAAELALDVLAGILPVDAQFPRAARAADVKPDGLDFHHAGDLLKGNELREFDRSWL
jgi:hypothetical protein